MKIFHCVGEYTNCEAHWQVPDIRWPLWCAAFQVDTLDGLFDMTPAESASRVITAAIIRFDTATEELRALLDPGDVEGMRGNKRRLQGMRTFLDRNKGHISGAFDESELAPMQGDGLQ